MTGAPFEAQFPVLTTNSTLQGATVAIYEIGCAIGALAIFFWGEKLGRRRGILLGMVILSIGAILQFMSYGLAQLIVGRVVSEYFYFSCIWNLFLNAFVLLSAGIGNGMTTSSIPVWQSETSRSHNRGRDVCIELGVNIFGVMLAYWVTCSYLHLLLSCHLPLAPLRSTSVFVIIQLAGNGGSPL